MTDNDTSADATSAAADATSAQSQATAAAGTDATGTSSTDYPDGTGDAGKRAIDRMKADLAAERTARKAAEKRAEELDTASKTETQQAIDKAKKDGNAEATAKYQASIRRAEVKAALTAAGINGSVLDLAIRASEFEGLTVGDDGEVEGLEAAVKAFKTSRADLFTKPVTPGTADGGSRGGTAVTQEQVTAWSKNPAQYEAHRDEILAFMGTKR